MAGSLLTIHEDIAPQSCSSKELYGLRSRPLGSSQEQGYRKPPSVRLVIKNSSLIMIYMDTTNMINLAQRLLALEKKQQAYLTAYEAQEIDVVRNRSY